MADPSRNIYIKEGAIGSAIVSGDGNTVYVISQVGDQHSRKSPGVAVSNPYKGLACFKESDGHLYFGRELQVHRLWKRFLDLFEHTEISRVLAVIGPSGCGKSSLVRAGLLPELARRPLPGKKRMRIVVMFPGTHPIQALAGVLAKLVPNERFSMRRVNEYEKILMSQNNGQYDGVQRISELMPHIRDYPLVILVDQFEELYYLCQDSDARHTFLETLFYASHAVTGHVSTILTLRSDFIKEAQHHPALNDVIGSNQSVIVPAMKSAELRRAIVEPATIAGTTLDESLVDLIIQDAKDREGSLPLLEFALTQIWDCIVEGKNPADAYWSIGRVGGALAGKAEQIYDSISTEEQQISKRLFLGLVEIKETGYMRRRASLESLTAHDQNPDNLNKIISKFSSPSARLLTLYSNDHGTKIVEVTHEALFEHWEQLRGWISDNRDRIHLHNRLEEAVCEWNASERADGLLWRSPKLRQLCELYLDTKGVGITQSQLAFLEASIKRSKRDAFARKVSELLEQGFVFNVVESRISALPQLLAEGLATGLVKEVLTPLLREWRGHRIATVYELDEKFKESARAWLEGKEAENIKRKKIFQWLEPIVRNLGRKTDPIAHEYGLPTDVLGLKAFFPNIGPNSMDAEIDTEPGGILEALTFLAATAVGGGGMGLLVWAALALGFTLGGVVAYIVGAVLWSAAWLGMYSPEIFAKGIDAPDWVRQRVMKDEKIARLGDEYKKRFQSAMEEAYSEEKVVYRLVWSITNRLEEDIKKHLEKAKNIINADLWKDAEYEISRVAPGLR